jgi:hypothetical protein
LLASWPRCASATTAEAAASDVMTAKGISMSLQSASTTAHHSPVTLRAPIDRRRHKRVDLVLLGRFMRANKQEYPCKLHDISVGGAAIIAPVEVEIGERIVTYFDQLGGLEGTVSRIFDGGFAIKLAATQHKREKLAALLTWLINRSELTPEDQRQHERIVPANVESMLKLAEGIVIPCRILDVSISGASIATEARPQIGHEVVLGKLRGVVVRHHKDGIGIRFVDIQNPAALRNHFG